MPQLPELLFAWLHLEDQLQRKLDIARRIERIRCCNTAEVSSARWSTVTVEAADDIARHSKQRRIRDVEGFRTELQFHFFSDTEVLEHRQIQTLVVGHVERIMSLVACRAKRLAPELADVDPLIVTSRERLRSGPVGAILSNADRILLSGAVQYCERLSGPVRINRINLPALDHLTTDASQRPPEREFVICGEREAVFHHVIARTVIAPKIIQYLSAADARAAGPSNIR